MAEPENYAKLIERGNPLFLEIKGFVLVGSSQYRLKMENMPWHEDVKAFAQEIGKHCGYTLVDEDPRSKVVLMMRDEDVEKRFLSGAKNV
jgi:tRNA wybutosine-synthesizing protein 1